MFKRILVALDASQTGELALETAIKLAKDTQARLRIVHAIDPTIINLGIEFPVEADVSDSLARSGKATLGKAAAIAEAAGVAAETQLITIGHLGQRIAEAIVADAEAWPADLIVIGTHGRHGLSRLFLGSVAEGVARVAGKPVLLIRAK